MSGFVQLQSTVMGSWRELTCQVPDVIDSIRFTVLEVPVLGWLAGPIAMVHVRLRPAETF